ncbi:transducin/WD40 repeat-like superfamily protein isoform X2 [Tasmannia lanceolata]|uniref:transducin/WD40 repeat-like superfamily protein isoform X2 n=1 Tax=Tasmannia lanceolata TaxID=3420 RepID=UPI0040646E75
MITGGKSLVSSSPAFSNDGKKLLVCTGSTVSVFSTSTGMQITELEGHSARVTSVIVVPVAAPASKILCYCWTSSLDGTIRYWDFSLPELIKKVDVQLPVQSMVIPYLSTPSVESNEKPSNSYAFVSIEDKQHKVLHGQIRMVNLTKSSVVGGPLAETQNPERMVVSSSGEFFGIRNGRKLHVWKVPTKDFKYDEVKKIKLHHTKNLTALAFHPTERLVAGGDATGRILIWRGFGKRNFTQNERLFSRGKVRNEEERPGVRDDDDADSCSTWHWHPTEVKFLSFSSDGAYLYSGGREGVLVVWQLDTGKKKFLPRIGSALLYFKDSPDPSFSSISCADNQIHLLKMPSMEILMSIAGIKVQVYERNYHPDDDVTMVVSLVALSIDGSKMGTVEVKLPEEGIGGLVSLKFWTSESRSGEYTLSTVIYEPHSDAGISALAFHPTRSMAVSSSYRGDFKIWFRNYETQLKDQELQKSGWRCQSVGSYKKRPLTAAAFSTDGSVLAVAAEAVITLWNPDTNVLVAVIGETLMPIVTLSFIGKSEYLVSVSRGSKPQLSVWSMSKLSMSWSYKLLSEAVTCTTDSLHFAVLGIIPKSDEITLQDRDGVILLFDAEDPIPVATWSVKKAKGGGLGFVQSNPSLHDEKSTEGRAPSLMLVYINGDHEYVIFNPYSREEHDAITNLREPQLPLEESERFGYASIYGELPAFNLKKEPIAFPFVPSDKPWETVFSGSSHVLPPLTNLCSAFLASLLEKRTSVEQ